VLDGSTARSRWRRAGQTDWAPWSTPSPIGSVTSLLGACLLALGAPAPWVLAAVRC
jgi:hypothetical protein